MAQSTVPTPLSLRWQRFREKFGPLLMLLLCIPVTLWLWQRHTGVVGELGEVLPLRVQIAAPADALIVNVAHRDLRPFDIVEAGEVVVRLDDRPVLASLATLQARIGVTQSDLLAETVRWRHDRHDTLRDHEITRQRLMIEIQELKLDTLDRRTAIEFNQIELQRIEQTIAELERLFDRGAETQFTLEQERLRRNALAKRVDEEREALHRAESQLLESQRRLAEVPDALPDELDDLLAPIRAAIRVHEAEIRELELQAEQLQIRSPISGVVAAIYARPGELAVAGQPLLTVASPEADSVVTYIRERNPIRPEVGAAVELRPIHHRGQPVAASIEQVGVQIELVPEHQRDDPAVPEWGLPVLIVKPSELDVRPGELVRVRFQ